MWAAPLRIGCTRPVSDMCCEIGIRYNFAAETRHRRRMQILS